MAESDAAAAADTFQCGSCREVFHDLELFEAHEEGDPCTVFQAVMENMETIYWTCGGVVNMVKNQKC